MKIKLIPLLAIASVVTMLGVGIVSGAILPKHQLFDVADKSSEYRRLVGDVNNNNEIDVLDFAIIQDYLVGNITIDDTSLLTADVNCDAHSNMEDVVIIQRYLAKLIDKFCFKYLDEIPSKSTDSDSSDSNGDINSNITHDTDTGNEKDTNSDLASEYITDTDNNTYDTDTIIDLDSDENIIISPDNTDSDSSDTDTGDWRDQKNLFPVTFNDGQNIIYLLVSLTDFDNGAKIYYDSDICEEFATLEFPKGITNIVYTGNNISIYRNYKNEIVVRVPYDANNTSLAYYFLSSDSINFELDKDNAQVNIGDLFK